MNQLLRHLIKKSVLWCLLGLAGISLTSLPSHAQQADWPREPIRLLVGYPPGGGTDTVARVVADKLSQKLGQPVVVENRPGVSGMISATAVARSKPDGYTLLFATGASLTGMTKTQFNGRQFVPLKDLAPITLVGGGPYILIANNDFPPNTLPELVAYAKKHPNKLNYASPGIDTLNYYLLEELNIDAGIKTTHVPYKGSSELMNGLMGGFVQYTLDTPGTTLPLIKAGKVKAIALLSKQRVETLSAVPTSVEQGFPKFVGGSWYAMLAPAETPPAIIQKINTATVAVLNMPEVKKVFDDRDITASGSSPAELTEHINAETVKKQAILAKIPKASLR